jgi:hypothetical protein
MLIWLSSWFVIVPLLVCIKCFRSLTLPIRIIFYHLITAFTVERISHVLMNEHVNNMPLLHIYTITEFLFISTFLKLQIQNKSVWKIITAIQLMFVCLSIFNSLFIQQIHTFNSYSRSSEALILIILILHLFASEIRNVSSKSSQTIGFTWINSGFIIYFTSNLFLFALNNYYDPSERNVYKIFWTVHATLCIFMYSLISIGIWKTIKR